MKRSYSSVVRTLIKHGVDPYVLDKEGQPLLAVAVEVNDADMVKFLLSHACAKDLLQGTSACFDNPVDSRFPAPKMMDDLVTEAARQNNPGVIEALYEYRITASTPSALFQAAEHVDGMALKCLLRLGKWKTPDMRNSLLLHSSLRLKEVCSMKKPKTGSRCRTRSFARPHQRKEKDIIDLAAESFEDSLQYSDHDEEGRANDDDRSPCAISIAGHCIKEAKDTTEFQQLLSTALPSSSLKPLTAIHLHGLLVMERLGDSRSEDYFLTISEQLWSDSSSSASVEVGLACYDLILHYIITVSGSTTHGCSHSSRLYSASHQFQCATLVCALLQWLLPKLSPGHIITVLPVFQWLHSLVLGPLKKKRRKILCFAAKMFGLSDIIKGLPATKTSGELQQSVALFSEVAEKNGRGWSPIFVALELEARRLGGPHCRHLRPVRLDTPITPKCRDDCLQSDHSATKADKHWLVIMASTLLQLGMAMPDLPGDLVHGLLQPHFSELLDVLVSYGLNVWVRAPSGPSDAPLLCSAVRCASEDTLRVLLRGLTVGLPERCSDEEVQSAYLQQLEDNGGDQWDLWSLAVECCNLPNAQVLHEQRIPASRKALLGAAIQADRMLFELLRMTDPWSAVERTDVLKLRSAYYLFEELKKAANQQLQSKAELQKSNDTASSVSSVHGKSFAFFALALRAQADVSDGDRVSSASTEQICLVGHEFGEAKTEQEFLELAEKSIPTESGQPLVNGVHVHGLLVMKRLVPRHPICYQYCEVLCELVTSRRALQATLDGTSSLVLDLGINDKDVIPRMACFQLLQQFLRDCVKMSFGEIVHLFKHIDRLPCLAAALATQLLRQHVHVSTMDVVKCAGHVLKMPQTRGQDVSLVTEKMCSLLLVMCQHKDVPDTQLQHELDAAVSILAKATRQKNQAQASCASAVPTSSSQCLG